LDFGRIVSDSWRMMRTTRVLWWLALISGVQIALYSVIVGGMIAPLAVITQLMVSVQQGGAQGSGNAAKLDSFTIEAGRWLSGNWPALAFVAFLLIALWAVAGIFDVAATAGLITQVDATAKHRPSSAASGLRNGFRLWWRTIGLLAVGAIPTLIYLLALALVMFFSVSLPLIRGVLPSPSAMAAGNAMTTPLSLLASLLSIPLGVLVALGLRFAVLGDCEWREAFGRAWALVKNRFVDVGLMYLIIVGIGSAISLAVVIAVSVLVTVFAFAVAGVLAANQGASALLVVLGGLLAAVCLALFLIVTVVVLMWQSVAWTIFWHKLVVADQSDTADARIARPKQSMSGSRPIERELT
jgi:hypothetical protein